MGIIQRRLRTVNHARMPAVLRATVKCSAEALLRLKQAVQKMKAVRKKQ
jgi:hypothetical protein